MHPNPETLNSRPVVMAIHGVGNPSPGELARVIGESLEAVQPGLPVVEVNWNQIVDYPVAEGQLRSASIEELSACLANACLACSDTNTPRHWSVLERALLLSQSVCFVLMEALVAFSCATVIFFPVGLLLAGLAARPLNGPDTGPLPAPWLFPLLGRLWFVAGWITVLFIAIGSFLSLARRDSAPLYIALRRCLLVALRPLILAAATPFLFRWRETSDWTRSTWKALRVPLLVGVPGILFLCLAADRVRTGAWPSMDLWEAVSTMAILAGISFLPLAMSVTVRTPVGCTTKIFLDIFRYVSNAGYRARIQRHVSKCIRENRPSPGMPREFFIAAHSLGTVIAVDSLINSREWLAGDVVTLISMGSPLRRFFHRFFPGLFFPRDAAACAKALEARFNYFRWINCYRPLDQVGTRIGLPQTASNCEASSGQWHKLFTAHPNYWGDPVILDILRRLAVDTPFSGVPPESPGTKQVAPTWHPRAGHRRWIAVVITFLVVFITVGAPIFGAIRLTSSVRSQAQVLRSEAAAALREGTLTTATVSYHRDMTSADPEVHTYRDCFGFDFADTVGVTRHETLTVDSDGVFQPATYMMNTDRLAAFLHGHNRDSMAHGIASGAQTCSVQIRFLPYNPSCFVPVDFPPVRGTRADLVDAVKQLGLVIFVTLLAILVEVFILAHMVIWLVGEPAKVTGD